MLAVGTGPGRHVQPPVVPVTRWDGLRVRHRRPRRCVDAGTRHHAGHVTGRRACSRGPRRRGRCFTPGWLRLPTTRFAGRQGTDVSLDPGLVIRHGDQIVRVPGGANAGAQRDKSGPAAGSARARSEFTLSGNRPARPLTCIGGPRLSPTLKLDFLRPRAPIDRHPGGGRATSIAVEGTRDQVEHPVPCASAPTSGLLALAKRPSPTSQPAHALLAKAFVPHDPQNVVGVL